ncbi:uncharacterized protein LOC106171625 [Lingula anatina]|uniref:Uncharacterized protein LOC106171625 n=1 Tax=Lingula anatina TaxID=7574 RepID=A0A1S3JBF2_LINAN|nr:uncharacterized protein LOC106171625 [Lingula anatina]|eukprot:XP_013407516.1 uncharacterized protein LOC106171625 [Lingula anatina]
MRRAEIQVPSQPLGLVDLPVPEPPSEGLVVKTTYAGVCHTDVHLWDDEMGLGNGKVTHFSDNPNYNFPIVPGHEISGVVHSLGPNPGPNAPDIKVGDKVIVFPWIGCRNCGLCKNGDPQLCPEAWNSLGMGAPGGYSTYVPVPERQYVIKVPESMPMDTATMLPCSGLTTFHAVSAVRATVEKMVALKGSASLLIIGAGGLGLWCIQIAKAVLPPQTRVIVADITTEKLETAKAAGADDVILWDVKGTEEDMLALTKKAGGGGLDAAIDLVNAGPTTTRALNALHHGGILGSVGLFGGCLNIPLPVFALKTQCVRGVYVGNPQQLKDLVALVDQRKLKPPPLVFYELDQATEVLGLLKKGQIKGRAILKL